MTNRDRVLQFLQSISPNPATNAEIVSRTGIRPHPQVFQITQELMKRGLVEGRLLGKDWTFWAKNDPDIDLPARTIGKVILDEEPALDDPINSRAANFEILAREAMSKHFGVDLRPKRVEQVRKKFDLVSADERIAGDAKYYTLVRGSRLPPAKFSVIAEYVWLLEKTSAEQRFLVFGNDHRVPELWLGMYGHLASGIEFYFLAADGTLRKLNGQSSNPEREVKPAQSSATD